MTTMPFFSGRGGATGGGGGGSVVPDSAKSRDTIEFVLGLGQGEFAGLVDGLKSFYLGDTQLQNDDGSYNFTAFAVFFNQGSPLGEDIVLRLGGAASSHQVGVQLSPSDPVVRTTSTRGINQINLRILFSQVYSQDDQGSIHGTNVNFRIEYKLHTGTTWVNPYGQDIALGGVKSRKPTSRRCSSTSMRRRMMTTTSA